MSLHRNKIWAKLYLIILTVTLFFFCVPSFSASTQSPVAYFINLQDRDKIPTTFIVQFGLKGMGIAPAGIDYPNTGHHHLLIDYEGMPNLQNPLGANDSIKHYGKGQTEALLTLSLGTHTLQLILGDHRHVPLNPLVSSEKITIEVSQDIN